ncbi:MAG TPA: ABC transporter ATP-binding protein [Candidatus Baltobacteraceae bacterium]
MSDPASAGAPVRFESVTVRYPNADRNAVDDVSFAIPAGSFTVFLGPSGCGKSTLLRTVNRLVVPRNGTVFVDDADVAGIAPERLRRGIGYVIQAVGLFGHMTVAANVAVVPELVGWDRQRVSARVDELLALVSLDPARYRNRYPRELSGGEQQRVGVARAIAAQPPVLLMDEPFGAVDAIVRSALQDETRRIARSLKTTILFVTHDVDEALRLADRIVVLREGRLVQYDTPLAILSAPATEYVERLLDTHDVVRRLTLLRARDAMRTQTGTTSGSIDAGASLRESLNAFLQGAENLAVTDDGATIGVLAFDDIRRALHP